MCATPAASSAHVTSAVPLVRRDEAHGLYDDVSLLGVLNPSSCVSWVVVGFHDLLFSISTSPPLKWSLKRNEVYEEHFGRSYK